MKKFTDAEITYLRGLRAVENVTSNRIIYSEEFKQFFLREYWNGRKPTEIFRDAGLPVVVLGRKRIERCTYRWVRGNGGNGNSAGLDGKSNEMIPSAEQGTMLALMETRNLLGDLTTALNRLERIILALGDDEAKQDEETTARDESKSNEDVDERDSDERDSDEQGSDEQESDEWDADEDADEQDAERESDERDSDERESDEQGDE